jgi:hypothetical protein
LVKEDPIVPVSSVPFHVHSGDVVIFFDPQMRTLKICWLSFSSRVGKMSIPVKKSNGTLMGKQVAKWEMQLGGKNSVVTVEYTPQDRVIDTTNIGVASEYCRDLHSSIQKDLQATKLKVQLEVTHSVEQKTIVACQFAKAKEPKPNKKRKVADDE